MEQLGERSTRHPHREEVIVDEGARESYAGTTGASKPCIGAILPQPVSPPKSDTEGELPEQ